MTDHSSSTRQLTVTVDGRQITWTVDGPFNRGENVVRLDHEDDLTASTAWADDGFVVADWLDDMAVVALRSGISTIVRNELEAMAVPLENDFELEYYHRFVDDDLHAAFTARSRCFYPMDALPVSRDDLEDVVSKQVNRRVSLIPVPGREPSFLVRVVRPASRDHSPPHRDHWLDHLRGTIAAYLPVVGCGPESSLPLVPTSHRWPESAVERTEHNGVADGIQYGIPAVSSAETPIELIRPVVLPGQIMTFSPYLIHGAGINLQADTTRVSLELRFR